MLIGMLFLIRIFQFNKNFEDGPLGDVRYSKNILLQLNSLVNLAIGGGFLYSGSFDDID